MARAATQKKPKSKPEPRPLLIIDGDSFAHRAYHALPKTIRMKNRAAAGAIVGFANTLLRLYAMANFRAVMVGWDTLEEETYRHVALPAYQSGREFDDDLLTQLDLLPDLVTACGFVAAKKASFEADDFLAAAVRREEKRGGICVVASGDRDTFQLVSGLTTVLFPRKGGEFDVITPAQVRARYGVDPHQVPDFIALRGDPSDKIPGARGIGAAGAAQIITTYGSLEAALKQGRLASEADALRLYRKIATMDATAPLPALRDQTPTWGRAAALMRDWELGKLAERFATMAAKAEKAENGATKPAAKTPRVRTSAAKARN